MMPDWIVVTLALILGIVLERKMDLTIRLEKVSLRLFKEKNKEG